VDVANRSRRADTVAYGASGSCSGNSCNYSGGAVGPNGGTIKGSGTIKRY
jgi:hypothetical protein